MVLWHSGTIIVVLWYQLAGYIDIRWLVIEDIVQYMGRAVFFRAPSQLKEMVPVGGAGGAREGILLF